jgi:hypothetical protein
MNKNDKIIAVVGVIILIIASIGIYTWKPSGVAENSSLGSFPTITSSFQKVPTAISVSDADPFLPLIATPLAVHYDAEGNQEVIPLYVENLTNPSTAVTRAQDEQIDIPVNLVLDNAQSAEAWSLSVASTYWNRSDAVLIIKNNETGYSLGVAATPLASYLSIPVIVIDELDSNVEKVLQDLGVKYSLLCGDIDGYGDLYRFKNVDDIIDQTIYVMKEQLKFDDINYITLTNPRDAWPPEVLNSTVVLSESKTLSGGNALPSHLGDFLKYGAGSSFPFTIPSKYKYALVKLDLKNLEDPRYVDEFGDDIMVTGSFIPYLRTGGNPAIRDSEGNVKEDVLHYESVFYDSGGEELDVTLTSSYTILKSAPFELTITVDQLSDPYYPMMKQLSSLAPYLTAYHKGIVYANPEFGFAADDDKILNGKTLPGNTQVFDNPILIPLVNQHVYQNIHGPLNKLLANLTYYPKKVDFEGKLFVYNLTTECSRNPFYIALVGDSIMLPQYYYRSAYSDPYSNPAHGMYGTNCPSDYLYGNIDPGMYSLLPYTSDYIENDMYSEFPIAENIVGRIVGYDVQDVSALIARTVFYDKVIDGLGEWKDNAAVLTGAGTDMQKLPVFTAIRQLLGETEPMKFPSGEKYFLVKRILNTFEQGGFNAQSAERGAAQRVGYSISSLREIKKDGLLNRLLFPLGLVKRRQGFENWKSLLDPEWWVKTLGDSSQLVIGGQLEQNSNLIISDSHAIFFQKVAGDVLLDSLGGPRIIYQLLGRFTPIPGLLFRTPLGNVGQYSVREVSGTEMGPSVMLVEGCGSGKIDGFLPTNSLACSYLHAGVNAYISPTTFSAFYGALEPRFGNKGVGFGIVGFIKTWSDMKRGIYVPVFFNQYIFEHANKEMFDDNIDIGTALRNAKNAFLPAQINITFRWTPPLSIIDNLPYSVQRQVDDQIKSTAEEDPTFPVEKYCTIYQINLLGDPAFNPYEPCNEGGKS